MGVIWFVGAVAFLLLEAVTYQMVSVYFALGAIGGLIAYLSGAGTYIQFGIFIIISSVLILLLRPISVRLLKNKDKDSATNTDALIDKSVYITEEVNNIKESGRGRVNGNSWSVRSADGEIIPVGSVAKIEKINGVRLIVRMED